MKEVILMNKVTKEEKISVGLDLKVSNKDIDYIMDDAFKGISYWCDEVILLGKKRGKKVGDQISLGGELEFAVGGDKYILNKAKLLKGLMMGIERYPGCITDEKTINLDRSLLSGDIIVQYALFEAQIYG